MAVRAEVLPAFYQDSVVLMGVAAELRGRPGVREAAAFMGTPANLARLDEAGLLDPASRKARPDDLVLTVEADSEAAALAALAAGRELLTGRGRAAEAAVARPRTLEAALRFLPDANLAAISVPGAYAAAEALRALQRSLHVFLFSDNVSLDDEIRLKQEALRRGLLCMGPDCGTAYLRGVGLGFFNAVARGRIGCVAASGSGLQAVACRIALLGEGISHGLGVGGRDLSAEVGGAMTGAALAALAADPETEVVVLISKPPAPTTLSRLDAALAAVGKPTVVACLGATRPSGERPDLWVETLDEAADAAVALLHGEQWLSRAFGDPADVRVRLARAGRVGGRLRGLYTGGTLAHEARLVLDPLVGADAVEVLDLGEDAYTVGRPHPIIDPRARTELMVAAGGARDVGVLLLDVVLGRGAHPDPAGPIVAALREARARAGVEGRRLAAVASVVGTPGDPQGLAGQVAQLEAAGIDVLPTNSEASRFAAMLLNPALAGPLLGAAG